MIDLELALQDLGEHLDLPNSDGLVRDVLRRISMPEPAASQPRGHRTRTLLAIAAVFVLIVGALLTIAPARHAIADWLGIGAVEIHVTDNPPPTAANTGTVPGAVGGTRDPAVNRKLAAARKAVAFPITTPRAPAAGSLRGVEVDRRIPGGLVALRYRDFTVVEIATTPGAATFGKFLDPSVQVEPTVVGTRSALWVDGAHEVAYLDRTGKFRMDTVRRSGPVLLWTGNGVTYRVEGLHKLADALRIAHSLR